MGWDRPGGLNRYLRDLTSALHQAGAAPRILVLGPADESPVPGLDVVAREDASLPSRLAAFVKAAAAAREVPVVDAHFALYAAVPVLVWPLRSIPLLVHFHGPWAAEARAGGRPRGETLRAALEGAVYRRADRVVVLSEHFGRLVSDDYGVDPGRVRVIPPGVDLKRFTPDRDGARGRLGMSPDRLVAFSARRLVPRMGLDVLVAAWRAAPPHALLVIAGEGAEATALRRAAEEAGLTDRVRLLGRVSETELVDWYRAADVVVLPSLALEGFGLAALEALACGTPVVVTDAGGLPEVVRELDPGVVVPAGNVEALAARLAAALSGDVPNGEACRTHAERFTWERAVSAHVALYDEIARPRRSADRRLRVVLLDHCARMSGAEIAALRLLPHLPTTDVRALLGEAGPLVDRLREAGVPTEVLPLGPAARDLRRAAVASGRPPLSSLVATARYVRLLRRRLLELEPDLVHLNSLKAGVYGAVAARSAGIPVVWHARDRIAADAYPAAVVVLVKALVWLLADGVVANSRSTLATLPGAGRHGRPARVVFDPYVPPAPVSTDRPAEAPLRIGIVGRLAGWKGQDVFLKAFARAFPEGDEVAVVVGGDLFGEGVEADLRQAAQRLGVADRVVFTGHVDDVASVLAGLDVLVHASTVPEPFGQVVVEGMCAGLAVVASDAGGPAEVVRHGADGLLTPPGDVTALAAALRRLADDPGLRRRLGAAARERAGDFAPSRSAAALEDAYRAVLRRRRRGPRRRARGRAA
jgi:glycosyltransferase involved in cell wall biosynthesis